MRKAELENEIEGLYRRQKAFAGDLVLSHKWLSNEIVRAYCDVNDVFLMPRDKHAQVILSLDILRGEGWSCYPPKAENCLSDNSRALDKRNYLNHTESVAIESEVKND
ncbi:MAG: hypothetical protein JW862_00605 [Anaerolineales bacterium]|nr:hypothetical protein [Anaerolineales bacterium]